MEAFTVQNTTTGNKDVYNAPSDICSFDKFQFCMLEI